MFKRVLVAVDGSGTSRKAVPVAIEMARRFDAELLVLYVAERVRGHADAGGHDEGAELVDKLTEEAQKTGVRARGEVHTTSMGHAPADIVETAKSEDAGLIVMGSRGLSDLAGLLLGSVAHKVLQLAHSPVLIVR